MSCAQPSTNPAAVPARALMVAAWVVACAVACFGAAAPASAQPDAASIRPLRTPPIERFTVNAGVRDWGPATVTGGAVYAGGPTGQGGLFAIDAASGRLRWTFRPVNLSGSVSSRPAVHGQVVMAPFGAANPGAVIGVSAVNGRELWRGPDPAVHAGVGLHDGRAYVMGKDGAIHALDPATGRTLWQLPLAGRSPGCASTPIGRDGLVYLTSPIKVPEGAPWFHASTQLLALDAKTGEVRWRYPAVAPNGEGPRGVCLRQPLVSDDTIFAIGHDQHLHAIDRHSGQPRFAPVAVRRPVDGRERGVDVEGLVDGGDVVIGMTHGHLIAFDKATGRTVWEIPGQYRSNFHSLAVAGRVLYFQGHPGAPAAAEVQTRILSVGGKPVETAKPLPSGTLQAIDLDTITPLWSFKRSGPDADWSFDEITPVDDGLWVGAYGAMIKLQ